MTTETTSYDQMELIEYDRREGGIYVKYHNRGDSACTYTSFEVRGFNENGKLLKTTEATDYWTVNPKEERETILPVYDWIGEPMNFSEYTIEVVLSGGYIEEES